MEAPNQQRKDEEMKRAVPWIAGVVLISVGLVWGLHAQEQKATSPADPAAAPTQEKPEKIVFTFADDAQMQEFAKLWQQRQATLTKMAVLQGYWNQEQTNVDQTNQQLLSQYKLDVQKVYTMDPKRKVLIEREAPSEQPAGVGQALAPTPPTTPPRAPSALSEPTKKP